ncbi:MAG: hypothetical protein ACE5G0_10765 [Rhodothermales bacterium]
MDEKLQIIQHLYGEGKDRTDLRRLLDDEALRAEYEALSEIKFQLDHRRRVRPDAVVIDRVMEAAQGGRAPLRRRRDRAARPSARRRLRLVGAAGAVLATLLVVSIGVLQMQHTLPVVAPEAASAEADALSPDTDLGGALAPLDERLDDTGGRSRLREELPMPAAPEETEARLMVVGSEGDTLPTWDEVDRLVQVRRYLDMLEARSLEETWDESRVMSLDRLPTGNSTTRRGVNAAGERRRGGNQ